MNPKAKALLLPLSWRELFDRLSDKEAAALIRAAFAIAHGEEVPEKGLPRAAFAFIPQMEEFIRENMEHYSAVCQKRRDAVNHRWNREKNKQDTNVPSSITDVSGCNTPPYKDDTTDTKSKSKSKYKYINPPLPPLGGLDKDGKIKVRWLMRCIGRFYHRRAATPWSKKELSALAGVLKGPEVLTECREIMRLYRGGYEYYRRDAVTLLNNWAGELDKARKERPAASRMPARPGRLTGMDQPSQSFSQNQRGKGGLSYD